MTISYRFLLRRGTAAALTAANEVPLDGEMVIESDTRKFKFGDGTTAWNSLAYAASGPTLGTGVATFLATPSSANLLAAVTDETGTGALVFGTSPTLTTPTLGAASATSIAAGLGLVGTPAYTFTGDLNTGMWSPAADTLALSTAGSEWVRIDSTGKVGVATTGATADFQVGGLGSSNRSFRLGSSSNVSLDFATNGSSGVNTITATNNASGASLLAFYTATGGTEGERLRIGTTGHTTPGADNTQDFGSGSLRWATIYAGTGTINTSDERCKVLREGGDLSEAEYLAWSAVRAIVYQDKDSFGRKGDAARLHVGYGWQAIRDAFAAQGLDASDYGLWCEDPILAPVEKSCPATRQAMKTVEQPFEEVQIVDGAPKLVRGARMVDQPMFEDVHVIDADTGEPVFFVPPSTAPEAAEPVESVSEPLMARIPVMEDYEETYTEMEPTGETRGALRYQECAVIEAAWLRRQIALVDARVAAIERALAPS